MKTIQTLSPKIYILLIFFAVISCKMQKNPPGAEPGILYGPYSTTYELPMISGIIYYVSPTGDAGSNGLTPENPTTIEVAISKVVTGDAIIMRGGTYRTGNLTFNQGITIQPFGNEKPIIKGTLVATDWQKAENGQWFTKWEHLFPAGSESWWRRDREEKFTPMHRFNNDGVFIDGKYLQSAGNKGEVNEGTFYVDYSTNEIFIGTDPTNRLVEITAFRKAIFRTTGEVHGKKSDERGPVIRGLEITQYPDTMVHIDGYYPQGISHETQHGKDVVGTVLDNCTFSNSFRIGVFSIGDSLIMRNCKVVDTNTEGVYIVASSDVLLEKNIFAHNNIEKWTGFFPAAVKIFNQSYRVTCRENKVIDHPFSNGIWYDVGNVDGVFVNNWLENVGVLDGPFMEDQVWPSNNAFFFEISKGAICAGNIFLNCDQGILILNSSNVEVYNNTFVNSRATFGRTARGDGADHFGWHPTTGPGVEERDGHVFMNNLITFDVDVQKPLLFVWQTANLCQRLNKSTLKSFGNNIYVRSNPENNYPIILWSPFDNENCQARIESPQELNKLNPAFSKNGTFLNGYTGNVFIDATNNNFHMSKEFSKTYEGADIPGKIIQAMGINEGTPAFIGAYPIK